MQYSSIDIKEKHLLHDDKIPIQKELPVLLVSEQMKLILGTIQNTQIRGPSMNFFPYIENNHYRIVIE